MGRTSKGVPDQDLTLRTAVKCFSRRLYETEMSSVNIDTKTKLIPNYRKDEVEEKQWLQKSHPRPKHQRNY
jgi:hypothetical protein